MLYKKNNKQKKIEKLVLIIYTYIEQEGLYSGQVDEDLNNIVYSKNKNIRIQSCYNITDYLGGWDRNGCNDELKELYSLLIKIKGEIK